jgi:hypothetical protein
MKLPTLRVSECNSGHKMDTIGGKRIGESRQVIEKMVSAEGIESAHKRSFNTLDRGRWHLSRLMPRNSV